MAAVLAPRWELHTETIVLMCLSRWRLPTILCCWIIIKYAARCPSGLTSTSKKYAFRTMKLTSFLPLAPIFFPSFSFVSFVSLMCTRSPGSNHWKTRVNDPFSPSTQKMCLCHITNTCHIPKLNRHSTIWGSSVDSAACWMTPTKSEISLIMARTGLCSLEAGIKCPWSSMLSPRKGSQVPGRVFHTGLKKGVPHLPAAC